MRIFLLNFIAFLGAASAAPVQAAPPSIAGNWRTDDATSIVSFYKCGSGMCGKIAKFLVPEPVGGARDGKNPDKDKRDRKLLGLPIFWNLSAEGDSWKGKGYTPKEGRTFNAALTPDGDTLHVKGCVFIICRTVTWTRP